MSIETITYMYVCMYVCVYVCINFRTRGFVVSQLSLFKDKAVYLKMYSGSDEMFLFP